MKIIVNIVSSYPPLFLARFEEDPPNIQAEGQTPEEAVGKLIIEGGFRKGLSLQMPDWQRDG